MIYKRIGGRRGSLPKKWTLKDGSSTGNFDLMPEAEHNAEGWYRCADAPVFDSATHKLGDDVLTDGVWVQGIVELTTEDVEFNEAVRINLAITQIDQACRDHLDRRIHWSASPMIYDKAKQNLPKNKAVKEWTEDCWNQYYMNKAVLIAGGDLADTMLIYPEIPHTIPELMSEV